MEWRANAPSSFKTEDLVDGPEIARRADVTVATIYKWQERYEETETPFPEPIMRSATAPFWLWPEIQEWLARPRATSGRPRTVAPSS